MKKYFRVMLGRTSVYAQECREGSFIGTDFDIYQDLRDELPERWQDFNQRFRPVWLEKNPGKTKVAAGLACGALHTVSKGILEGDIVLCPDGQGVYWVGEVFGNYSYQPGGILPIDALCAGCPKRSDGKTCRWPFATPLVRSVRSATSLNIPKRLNS